MTSRRNQKRNGKGGSKSGEKGRTPSRGPSKSSGESQRRSGKSKSTKDFFTYHSDRPDDSRPGEPPSSRRGPRPSAGGFQRPPRAATRPEDRFEVRTPESPTHPPQRSRKSREDRGAQETRPRRDRPFDSERGSRKVRGTVDKNRKGFAFISLDSKEFEDLFIPPREAEPLFHGDRVEVTINSRDEVIDLSVVEHRFRELVGRFSPHLDPDRPSKTKVKSGFVIYERRHRREEVFVPSVPAGVRPGDWVLVRLRFQEEGTVTGEIARTYGEHLPPSADIEMVSGEYNLIEEHTEAAEREARDLKLDVPAHGPMPGGRLDLRKMKFITIDGETARDFDDAVFVERKKDGYSLWVAIADVSHYVQPDSAIDKEAYSRATSVYFPERAFHMLPRALSENLCSLRPHEPRMAMAARMDFDKNGKRTNTEVFDAVIESKRRATYTEIENEFKSNQANPDWEFSPHFELYGLLRKHRSHRGSLDFEFPEAETRVDETGDPISISVRDRMDTHRLIEEFMIAANEAVTEWMMERKWPFVYRVHEEPAPKAMTRFIDLAATMGADLQISGDFNHPKKVSDAIKRLQGHPAEKLLSYALLRSLKQAVYSSTHGIHYGLASQAYTHFTSPIRRYPDLIVHRLIREAVRTERGDRTKPTANELEGIEKYLEEATAHCSYRERIASEAERESIKLKQIRMMMKHLGGEFDATIIGMADKGMFAEVLEPYAEGMIPRESLKDDFYAFNEERMIFYGRRKRRTFRIGDKVKIRVVRASVDERLVEFELLDHTPTGEKVEGDLGNGKKRERGPDRNRDKSHRGKPGRKRRGRGAQNLNSKSK